MVERKNFDLIESPLEKTNLIEASAGTGKTYAITGLFLRLLLEKRLSVSEILVVTYTVAATEELRDRIRRSIRAAHDAFALGGSAEPFLDGLVKKNTNRENAIRILKTALRNFDEAPIYTIHGFCLRVLQENAFESMGLFDTELVPDERTLKEEIGEDFWRTHFYNASKEFVSYVMSRNYSPQEFLKLTRGRLFNPNMKILPEVKCVAPDALEAFRCALDRVRVAWRDCREDVFEKLKDTGLSRVKYKNPESLIARMDSYINSDTHIPLFDQFDKFTASALRAGTNKNKTTPEHPFFLYCEDLWSQAAELEAQMEVRLLFLKIEIFRYLRQELPKRKQQRNIQFYDDLLCNLKDALEKAGGGELAENLRCRYRAALIDEFQDTDPIQYTIFQTIFRGENTLLFLIGDPKQSIYSFRGADLFAYMRAARHVDFHYTLKENWRSEPHLISAVNAVFANPPRAAFLYDEIPFSGSVAADVKDRDYLTIDGRSEAPFHLWYLDGGRLEAVGAKENKGLTGDLIIEAVAAEIAGILNLGRQGRAMIGGKPLLEEDIAVLVRTNGEARQMRATLTAFGVPCVLHSMGNLFDAHESLEVKRILAAIEECRSDSLIKTALATDMLGLKGEDLDTLEANEAGWDEWTEWFREYNELWERYGFIEMFRHLISKEKVRERLLAFPDGERRLTNVLHLMEVLHTTAVENKLGMTGLMKWLARQMDPESLRLEVHELRLESDARAVKIVTIHKSKGLEYPIVFCPFNWSGSKIKDKEFTYHDPAANWQMNLVLDAVKKTSSHPGLDPGSRSFKQWIPASAGMTGSSDDSPLSHEGMKINPETTSAKALAEKELLAENIRLLYVALTRAKNRCYLVWGPFKEAGTSSLAYILHPPEGAEGASPEVVTETESRFNELSDADIHGALACIAAKASGAISVYDMPAPQAVEYAPSVPMVDSLFCRTFTGITDRDRRIASFSYLLHDRTTLTSVSPEEEGAILPELPDHDGGLTYEEKLSPESPAGIFSFPRGARAGNLLHEVLEQVDFTTSAGEETSQIVTESLNKFGFDAVWQNTVCGMIENVVQAPLQSGFDGIMLSEVKKEDRVSELEFYFPLNRLTPEGLQKILTESGLSAHQAFPANMGRLQFQPVRGFMKGFMDLMFCHEGRFFLVDWKSNYLGTKTSDYGTEALTVAMQESFYILQYHLYCVALNRYLKMRQFEYDYERHFGGVFYIFLRGVDAGNGGKTGIFYDRPAKATIDYLCESLIVGR